MVWPLWGKSGSFIPEVWVILEGISKSEVLLWGKFGSLFWRGMAAIDLGGYRCRFSTGTAERPGAFGPGVPMTAP